MASSDARPDAEVVFRQGAPGRVPGRRSLFKKYFWNNFLFEGGRPFSIPAPCCAGDREVTYIYVDLSEVDPATDLSGATLRLEELDTSEPKLVLEDGRVICGRYEVSLGSYVAFAKLCEAKVSALGAEADERGADITAAPAQDGTEEPCSVQYLCHTERCLRFCGAPSDAPCKAPDAAQG